MVSSPCKNCTARHTHCHAKCVHYIDFKYRVDKEVTHKREVKRLAFNTSIEPQIQKVRFPR